MQEMLSIAEEFQKKNLLNFNLDKSEQMIMKYNKKRREVERKNVLLNGKEIKTVESYNYLGDIKCYEGTQNACIANRISSGMGVINEIKFLVKQEAFIDQSLEISIRLVETILIPKVIYACETWTNLTKKNINDLERLQKDALTLINGLPKSTPYDGLIYECGLMPMEYRIKEKRLLYLQKILKMNENRMTKMVYDEQKRLNFPNCWYEEVMNDLNTLNITLNEKEIGNLSKEQWKTIVRNKYITKIEDDIKSNDMTKLRFIKDSNFGMKEYVKCKEGSLLLKVKLNMVELKANYKGKFRNTRCRRCGTQDEYIEHLWECKYSSSEYRRIDKACLLKNNIKALNSISRHVQEFLQYPC